MAERALEWERTRLLLSCLLTNFFYFLCSSEEIGTYKDYIADDSTEFDSMGKLNVEQDKLILSSIQERARRSLQGTAKRAYIDGQGHILSSAFDLAIANILNFADIEYSYKKPVLAGKRELVPTFTTKEGFIVTEAEKDVAELRYGFPTKKVLHVTIAKKASALVEIGVPIVSFDDDAETDKEKLESIFMDDPSFAFDYSHILPWTEKCSVLHGHTSSVIIELIGQPKSGMIVDFSDVKRIVKEVLSQMDHKLFISKKYMIEEDSRSCRINFDGPNGEFDLKVPRGSTFLMASEATIENLADLVLKLLAPKMPKQVQGIGVYIYEGLNKGSHIMTALSRRR
jgi:6-pyruvoyltetrahydropterin/6-carboxytetrahydropterin synthase